MIDSTASVVDFVVIGSGFGGSVCALRLAEKGYSVVVLERGSRFRDEDFARTNRDVRRYLWLPALRCFGILQITWLRGVLALHGSGVGGGSLGYANVLVQPGDEVFAAQAWRRHGDWRSRLAPHYATASRMLGVAPNPEQGPADDVLLQVAAEYGTEGSFHLTDVGVFFGEPRKEVPDPYFDGQGPPRAGCNHCGACMIGCPNNAKNTLVKNYLYLAEKAGVTIRAESEAVDIRPVSAADGARYEVVYRKSTSFASWRRMRLRARNVVVAAGALGSVSLLLRCRDETGSLRHLSPRVGSDVRTNSEALLGVTARNDHTDYSHGLAITSIFQADPATHVEPVRYPEGFSVMRLLAAPLVDAGDRRWVRLWRLLKTMALHPVDLARSKVLPGWARRTTIVLVMQSTDSRLRLARGRGLLTGFRKGLVSVDDEVRPLEGELGIAHDIVRRFAALVNGVPQGSFNETLLNTPTTAHLMGGMPMGTSIEDGAIDAQCRVFGYPGMYVVDGSVIPGNPGVNPSLTITALAEYAMALIPAKGGPAETSSHDPRVSMGRG